MRTKKGTIRLESPLRRAFSPVGGLVSIVSIASRGSRARRLALGSATLHGARDSRRAGSPQTLRHVFSPFLSSRSLANTS